MLFAQVRGALRCAAFFLCMLSWNCILWFRLPFVQPDKRAFARAGIQRYACIQLSRILGVRVVAMSSRPHAGAFLIAANHLSVLDAIVLASVFDVAFLGKSDIAEWPVVGWVTRTVGMIPVHRDRRMATSDLVQRVRDRLHSGVSVLVFPEGTTSDGTALRRFKTGAFESVVDIEDAYVLPVCLAYSSRNPRTRQASEIPVTWHDPKTSMTSHCWDVLRIRKTVARVYIGEPQAVVSRDRRSIARSIEDAVQSLREEAWPELADRGSPEHAGS